MTFAINDHVKIIGSGKTGIITEHWPLNKYNTIPNNNWEWIVRLDGECLDCAVEDNQIEGVNHGNTQL
jgi:hypothetical protein